MADKPLSVDQALSKAKSLAKKGNIDQSIQIYREVLEKYPRNNRAKVGLKALQQKKSRPEQGVVANPQTRQQIEGLNALYKQGRLQEALDQGAELAERYPYIPLIQNILGSANAGLGRLDQAVAHYKKALQIDPNYAAAHNNLGNALVDLGKHEAAIASYSAAVKIKPDHAGALYNLGAALAQWGKHKQAIASYTQAVQVKPDFAEAHCSLGNSLMDIGEPNQAIAAYTKALQIRPDYADAHYHMANAQNVLGKSEEAIASYTRAVQIEPDHFGGHSSLGNIFIRLRKPEAAIASYTKALQVKPESAGAYNNLANALFGLGKYDEAIAAYAKAAQIDPGYAGAHYNLGNAYMIGGRHEDAIASFADALRIDPDYTGAQSQKLYQQAHICDWAGLERESSAIAALGTTGTAVEPFCVLTFEDHPARHRQRSEIHAAHKYNLAATHDFARPRVKPDRLRIGYFSADFHNHATMYLMVRLFELHDKAQFAIHAYSYGPDKGDEMQARLTDAVDIFHDVRGLGDNEVAQLARDEKIDIAVDLKGYTQDSRCGIFAYRAAPIQLNYLGYPGTMGAPFIDYIVADQTLIPPDARKFYSEKVVYLPHSYQVNDNTRRIAEETPARADVGLPETGFVFCCFNNTYKISPREFDIWMRLLHKIDGSVLWLLKANPSAEKNLLQEAQSRGVDPARLVFAERMPLPEHLARQRLGDLFLDTFNYNAHTTASDALWAGLPVLTKLGEGFAARVAGSLLNAIDLPELITANEQAYENLALELATHPEQLQAIKDKLRANRDTKPLFDTELFTEHLEEAYRRAYDLYFEGAKPEHIVVGDGVNL